jgi:hypothetical protein
MPKQKKKPTPLKIRRSVPDESKKEKPEKVSLGETRIEQYYYKIVFAFVALTAAMVVMIVYFAFAKTDITVYAQPTTTDIVLEATLQDLDGVLMIADLEDTVEYDDFTGVEEESGFSTGTVTMTNETTEDQPLVSTTRLLSASDNEDERILFRTQEYVVVPAQGSIDVTVIADEEGASGDIEPAQFEVVALDDSLKESIYGQSEQSMTGGLSTETTVGEEDIVNAQAEARNRISQKAIDLFRAEVKTREGMPPNPRFIESVAVIDEAADSVSADIGETVDELTISQTLTVAAPVINTEALMDFINSELPTELEEDSVVTSNINPEELDITLQSVSDNQTNAQLQILLTVETSLSTASPILDLAKLTNKTEDEVNLYLTAYDEIDTVEVDFSPFWARRTGGSQDSIKLTIEAVDL